MINLILLANLHDWSFVQRCMDILVGVSCCKSVPASTFAEEWENNKESIYRHIENAHMGFKGVVLRDEKPVEDIYVEIYAGADRRTNERGEYWILQLPGEYEVYDDFQYDTIIVYIMFMYYIFTHVG